jgi:hypothetical protein
MKSIKIIFLFLFLGSFLAFSQNENPYLQFGYEAPIMKEKVIDLKSYFVLYNADTTSLIVWLSIDVESHTIKFYSKDGNLVSKDTMLLYSTARWIVPDPAGQHWSPYMSMGNNPISYVDPDGMFDTGWNWLNKAIGCIPGFTSRSFAGGTDVVWTGLNMNVDWHVRNFFRNNSGFGDMLGIAPNGFAWVKVNDLSFVRSFRQTFDVTEELRKRGGGFSVSDDIGNFTSNKEMLNDYMNRLQSSLSKKYGNIDWSLQRVSVTPNFSGGASNAFNNTAMNYSASYNNISLGGSSTTGNFDGRNLALDPNAPVQVNGQLGTNTVYEGSSATMNVSVSIHGVAKRR